MVLSKFLACTVCVVTLASAGCADGTGTALVPTLPTADVNASNADGTKLKASAPQTASPRSAIRVANLTPQLTIQNGGGTFTAATLAYEFEVYEGPNLVLKSEAPITATTDEQTVWSVPANTLQLNKIYSWHARAIYNGVPGSWSDAAFFRTPLPPPTDGPVFCPSSAGPSLIACVGAAYPEKLVSTAAGDGSLERRHRNMEFIRDRIIETGKCKGVDLGRNFKRGTPVISHDFIVLRQPGQRDRGVDIASGYDDVNKTLKLTWQVFGPERDYGFPYYANYGPVDCSGV